MFAHEDANACQDAQGDWDADARSKANSGEAMAWCFLAMCAIVTVMGWVELVSFAAGALR